jgi:hypothetical protein
MSLRRESEKLLKERLKRHKQPLTPLSYKDEQRKKSKIAQRKQARYKQQQLNKPFEPIPTKQTSIIGEKDDRK